VILTDGDIFVRPVRLEDAEALFEAAHESIPEVSPWLPWCHKNYAIEETRAFLSSRTNPASSEEAYSFGIFNKSSERFLGGVGLNFFNRVHQMANLGYWVRTSETGKGVASRATRLVAKFGFAELGLQRLEIIAAVGNIASQRVAEKAGAVRECVARKRLLINGEPLDAVVFSLLREDFNSGTDFSP
jgi:RimJ/RimL family protein N-acetyltransferase